MYRYIVHIQSDTKTYLVDVSNVISNRCSLNPFRTEPASINSPFPTPCTVNIFNAHNVRCNSVCSILLVVLVSLLIPILLNVNVFTLSLKPPRRLRMAIKSADWINRGIRRSQSWMLNSPALAPLSERMSTFTCLPELNLRQYGEMIKINKKFECERKYGTHSRQK